MEHSASYVSRLLAAAGGSLRFGCQHPAPRRIRSRGNPLRIAAVTTKEVAQSVDRAVASCVIIFVQVVPGRVLVHCFVDTYS